MFTRPKITRPEIEVYVGINDVLGHLFHCYEIPKKDGSIAELYENYTDFPTREWEDYEVEEVSCEK